MAVGAGSTTTIDTSSEIEIARIPITESGLDVTNNRLWAGAVGAGGLYFGFVLSQETDHIGVTIKPHTSASGQTGKWGSGHFAYPLADGYVITLGS